MKNLAELKRLLEAENFTCVLSDGKEVISFRERGVKPLVELVESGKNFRGYFAADKAVGKAAALLYVLLGVSALYAGVISEPAAEVCRQNKIEFLYGTLTPRILNRRGDGICPMEQAVEEISDPQTAFFAVKERLKNL